MRRTLQAALVLLVALPAVAQNPNAVDYAARGRLRDEHGDLDGALDDYAQAIRREPTQGWLYDRRGGVLAVSFPSLY